MGWGSGLHRNPIYSVYEPDKGIQIWELASGKPVLWKNAAMEDAAVLTFSPDGTRLASAGLDHVILWDLAAGEELLALRAGTGGFHGVAFSPDGQRIAAAGMDGSVRIWDATPDLDGSRR